MADAEIWTIQKLIHWTTSHFTSKKMESARLDAEILLAHTLNCKRLDLYLSFDKPLKPSELQVYRDFIRRRSLREPVAYITGTQEFYGRPFNVGAGVLIPRPETEHLIEEILNFTKETGTSQDFSILDIGTGSGSIGLTLSIEAPRSLLTLLDISKTALEYAQVNAKNLGSDLTRLNFIETDFKKYATLPETFEKFDIVVSNPPYVSKETASSLDVDVYKYEPHEALFGGLKGYELIVDWLTVLPKLLKPGGLLVIEIGFDQSEFLRTIFEENKNFDTVKIKKDYAGNNRVIVATKAKKA